MGTIRTAQPFEVAHAIAFSRNGPLSGAVGFLVVVSLSIDSGDGGQAPACANADAVAPQILPKYYIEVETRTYSEDEDSELLIGIPDAAVLSASKVRSLPQNQLPESVSVAMQSRPQRVQLPMGLEVRERYLEVRELGADAVITVIELLSPSNKRTGKNRVAYEDKRQRVLESASHFIELDLLLWRWFDADGWSNVGLGLSHFSQP